MTVFLWVYSAVALVGLITSAINVYDGQIDLQAVKIAQIRDGRQLIALSNLRTQIFRAVECAILLSIALLVLADVPVVFRRPFATVGLTIVSLLVITNSVLDRLAKRRLLGEIYEELRKRQT